jgi:cell wall-associated NlpC family hydrolase
VVAVAACAVTFTGAHAASASPSTSDLTKQIDAQSKQLEIVGEQYNAMNISLQKTQSDLTKLQASLAPAKAALQTASAQVNSIASTAYQQGRIGPMSALLDGDSSDLMAKMSYLDQIQTSNQHDIDTFTQTTQTFAQRQAELASTKAKQAAQLTEIAARRASIQASIKRLRAERTTAYGSPTESSHTYNGPIPNIAGSAGKAVTYAYEHRYAEYDIGGTGPKYDCSGLTMMAWKAAGYSLPHNAAAQWGVVTHISRGDLKPGDLVFYDNLGHVGIYVGSNMIIDAPTYGKLVDVRSINRGMPIYGYGRVT